MNTLNETMTKKLSGPEKACIMMIRKWPNAMIILKYICYLKTKYDISQEVSFKFLKYLKNFKYWSFELGNEQFEPPPRHFYHIT